MEQLEDASPEEQGRAVAAEWARLRDANDTPESLRAFASRQQQQQQTRTSLDSFLGERDRAFLSRATQRPGDRLPAAQTRASALPLQRVIALGDAQRVRSELERVLICSKGSGQPPARVDDLRSSGGETLLHTAVLHEQLGVAQMLLALGASPHVPLPSAVVASVATAAPSQAAAAPSSVAPRSDNFRCSRLLHAGEATAIHYACAVGNLDMLKLLLSRGNRSQGFSSSNGEVPGSGSRSKWPPLEGYRSGSLLLWAIARGHAHMAEFLLRDALESDCSDEDGNNAFGVAALLLGHDLDALRSVLRVLAARSMDLEDESDARIDINHRNALGLTAFDVSESPEVRQALARFGAHTARVVPIERVLRWDREAFRRDVRLCSQDPSRPRAAVLRQSGDSP